MSKKKENLYHYVTLETNKGPKPFRADFLVLATFRPIAKEEMKGLKESSWLSETL